MSLKQTKITIYIFVLKNLFRVLRTKWSFNESKEVHEENMPTLHTKFIKILSVLREYFHPFVVYLKKDSSKMHTSDICSTYLQKISCRS